MSGMEDEEERIYCPSLGFKPGRPRSEVARQAILRAAHKLLVRDGFAALTMEAIAGEAGVSKATLYRWWPCKATVVMDGFLAATDPCCAGPDTGDVREDLSRRMRGLTQVFSGCQGKVIAGVLAEALSDPEAAEAFRRQYLAPRRAEAIEALTRALVRGEIRPDADLETAVDSLYGPIYFRLLTGHAPLTTQFADSLVSTLLDGLLQK